MRAQSYNGDMGTQPPTRSRSRAHGQEVWKVKPQKNWKPFCFVTSHRTVFRSVSTLRKIRRFSSFKHQKIENSSEA